MTDKNSPALCKHGYTENNCRLCTHWKPISKHSDTNSTAPTADALHEHEWQWINTYMNPNDQTPSSLLFVCPCGAYKKVAAVERTEHINDGHHERRQTGKERP